MGNSFQSRDGVQADPLSVRGKPALMSVTRSQVAATLWLSNPSASTKARTSRPKGMTPKPISLPTKTIGPGACAIALHKSVAKVCQDVDGRGLVEVRLSVEGRQFVMGGLFVKGRLLLASMR
jgi:hypothetical protein